MNNRLALKLAHRGLRWIPRTGSDETTCFEARMTAPVLCGRDLPGNYVAHPRCVITVDRCVQDYLERAR